MKTPTTKLSKQKYRPIRRQFFILFGVIGITAIAITGTASASSLTESFNFSMFQFKEKEVYQLGKISQEKAMKLSSVETEAEKVIAESEALKKETLDVEKQLNETKASVEKLSEMFVKIDKYAPDSAGNAYAPGNCTAFVKSMRPDISSYWGNASNWFNNAKNQGWNVGELPKKGAIATTSEGWAGHVAFVTGVSIDQQLVTIKEMNYGSPYVMNTRTVPASDFKYIYELN